MTETVRVECEGADMVALEHLQAFQGDLKTLSDENYGRLRALILRLGFSEPVGVWRHNVDRKIINGHQRLRTLLRMRDEGVIVPAEIPVNWIEAASEREAKEKVLSLTSQFGTVTLEGLEGFAREAELDLPDLAADFRFPELPDLAKMIESEQELEDPPVPELPDRAITKSGDLWIMGDHKLLCGDSTCPEAVAALMGGEKADCVFTSPPYAVGIEYGTYKDTIENLRAMLPTQANLWADVIVEGGFAVVNFGDIAGGREAAEEEEPCEFPMAIEYWPIFRAAGWRLWARRIWCKPNARVHAPWTMTTNRAATDWEHVWTWVRSGKPLDIRNGALDRQGWFDTTHESGVDVKKEVHGAGMAVGCAHRMLRVHSRRHRIVYEPFAGTGTTLITAEQLGRRCFGIEIEPQYADVCVQRWQSLTGRIADCVRP